MASSKVSSIVLFLILLLVFPQMDEALGTNTEVHKLKETNHPDQVTVQRFKLPSGIPIPKFIIPTPKYPKFPNVPRRQRLAPPPPQHT